jgi:hypothetical protein
MKNTKLITVFIFLLLFSNALNALNPSADDKANRIIEKLSQDIVLTESQKAEITGKVKVLMTSIEKVKVLMTSIEKVKVLTNSYENNPKVIGFIKDYKMALDSILTTGQKQQLLVKRNERREALINKYMTKK